MNGKESRVLRHRNYQFLDNEAINARFDGMGVTDRSKMSYELIRDLSNYHSHILMGEDPERGVIHAKQRYRLEDFSSEEEYWKRIAYHNNILNFIRNININMFTGNTPAQKAASVMLAINNLNKNQDNSEGEGDDSKMMDYFKPTDQEVEDAKAGKESSGQKKKEEEPGKKGSTASGAGGDGRADRVELLENFVHSTIDHVMESPVAAEYFQVGAKTAELAMGQLSPEQRKILEQLSIVSSMGTLKTRQTLPGKEYGRINDIGDVVYATPKSQLLSPSFNINLLEKNILTSKSKAGGKQTLIYLIDDSGSMSVKEKVRWVKTIMIDRLEAVAKNKAELYVAWYIEDILPKSVIAIKTKQQAKDFAKRQFFGNFNGGNTNIERTIENAIRGIVSGNFYGHRIKGIRPGLVLINDGQDYIKEDFIVPSGITLNSFILGEDNKNLKKVTERSRGTYARFL